MKTRIITILAATLAWTVILGAGCGATTSTNTVASAHNFTKSYLMDFQGTVASPQAGAGLASGEGLYQMTTGAWQITYHSNTGLLCLRTQPSWCVAANNGIAVMRQAIGPLHKDWIWDERVQASGGIRFWNLSGGYLCALGGDGTSDIVVQHLSGCPGGASYDKWFFNGTTAK